LPYYALYSFDISSTGTFGTFFMRFTPLPKKTIQSVWADG